MNALEKVQNRLARLKQIEMETSGLFSLHGSACLSKDKIKENDYRQSIHAAIDKMLDISAEIINEP